MILNPFVTFILAIFLISSALITLYTCNFYYLAFLASRRKEAHNTSPGIQPSITIHLPIYNEKYVAARLVDAVCAMDYPRDKMHIMVLDDSDDDTVSLMAETVTRYKKEGFAIEHIRRGTRTGYKAGALKHAMKRTDSEFVAIFDADFIPPTWFLKRALSHFTLANIGLVQCRWGHVNEDYSAITKAQALSLDFHFLVEQKAKSNSHLFMSFNGTAGIWRRQCIEDAGGWHTATLVEDLDLSYRAQMRGWKCIFLPDIVVDAELPVQMNAAKRQQFRWAKGSIQCAVKLLGDIATKRRVAFEAKFQAFIQLTRHIVYPFLLIQFLALPILLISHVNLYLISFIPAITIAAYLAMGPGAYILIIQRMYSSSWKSKVKVLPSLLVYNTGLSINNTVAVFDAVIGKKNEFLRTPKYGITKNDDQWKDKAYNLPFTKTTLLEIFFVVYGMMGIMISFFTYNPVFAPIIGIQTVGFFYIAYLSLSHSKFKRNKFAPDRPQTREERMANVTYKLAMIAIITIISFGIYMTFQGYIDNVYPLDLTRGHLSSIIGSSDLEVIAHHLAASAEKLPASGNPVWLFQTDSTDFGRIQQSLAYLSGYVETMSVVPTDSSSYHTAMLNVNSMAFELKQNLIDATPYVYASQQNILFSTLWIGAIMGIFAVLKRKKDQLLQYDEATGV